MSDYETMAAALARLGDALPRARREVERMRLDGEGVDHRIFPPSANLGGAKAMLADLTAAAKRLGVRVVYSETLKFKDALGHARVDGTIVLRRTPDSEAAHVAHVLAHELVHAIWHGELPEKDLRTEEVEAECCATALSALYGCASMDAALYLATYHVAEGRTIERLANRAIADAIFLRSLGKGGV